MAFALCMQKMSNMITGKGTLRTQLVPCARKINLIASSYFNNDSPNSLNKLNDLNKLDEVCITAPYRKRLCDICPREFHDFVNSMDRHIVCEIEYICILFKHPLDMEQRVSFRKRLSKIVKSKEWDDHELEFFIWLLRYYRAF